MSQDGRLKKGIGTGRDKTEPNLMNPAGPLDYPKYGRVHPDLGGGFFKKEPEGLTRLKAITRDNHGPMSTDVDELC
ncbi:MAG: hypothetical protein NVSMB9_24110 [Isosphaeraceae bacterium]